MSVMRCVLCEALVDTDDDPDSLYVLKHKDHCICRWCREANELETEFD